MSYLWTFTSLFVIYLKCLKHFHFQTWSLFNIVTSQESRDSRQFRVSTFKVSLSLYEDTEYQSSVDIMRQKTETNGVNTERFRELSQPQLNLLCLSQNRSRSRLDLLCNIKYGSFCSLVLFNDPYKLTNFVFFIGLQIGSIMQFWDFLKTDRPTDRST